MTVEPAKGGDKQTIETDVMLVSIGRKPYTDNLGLKEVGVKLDERGRVATDAHFKTNVEGIWAIGIAALTRCWRTRPKTRRSPVSKTLRASAAM